MGLWQWPPGAAARHSLDAPNLGRSLSQAAWGTELPSPRALESSHREGEGRGGPTMAHPWAGAPDSPPGTRHGRRPDRRGHRRAGAPGGQGQAEPSHEAWPSLPPETQTAESALRPFPVSRGCTSGMLGARGAEVASPRKWPPGAGDGPHQARGRCSLVLDSGREAHPAAAGAAPETPVSTEVTIGGCRAHRYPRGDGGAGASSYIRVLCVPAGKRVACLPACVRAWPGSGALSR